MALDTHDTAHIYSIRNAFSQLKSYNCLLSMSLFSAYLGCPAICTQGEMCEDFPGQRSQFWEGDIKNSLTVFAVFVLELTARILLLIPSRLRGRIFLGTGRNKETIFSPPSRIFNHEFESIIFKDFFSPYKVIKTCHSLTCNKQPLVLSSCALIQSITLCASDEQLPSCWRCLRLLSTTVAWNLLSSSPITLCRPL